ncbi:MAG: hypothetical protein P8104_07630, partial [Gammaproteobacteria bacterium]
ELSLPAEIWLYVDFHASRVFYQRDIKQLRTLIANHLGNLGIGTVVEVWERRSTECKWRSRRWNDTLPSRVRGPLPLPDESVPCLVMTDEPEAVVWRVLSRQLQERGCRVVVVPYTLKGPCLKRPCITRDGQSVACLSDAAVFTHTDLNTVLSALSLTPQRFSLGLVRALREELTTAGPALEHHIVSYPGIEWSLYENCGQWRSGYTAFHEVVKQWGSRGTGRPYNLDANKVHEIMCRHLEPWYSSVYVEYLVLALALMPPSWSDDARQAAKETVDDFYRRLTRYLLKNEFQQNLEWFLRSERRLGSFSCMTSDATKEAFTVASFKWNVLSGDRYELPDWDETLWHNLTNDSGASLNKKSGYLRSAGNRLEVVALESGEEPEDAAFGVTVAALDDVKSLMGVPERLVNERLFRSSGDSSIEPVTHRIQSRHEIIELKGCASTDFYWAQSLSVTDEGVLATTEDFTLFWPSSGEHDGPQIVVGEGAMPCFGRVGAAPVYEVGVDEYGLYALIPVASQQLVMRYIPPGSFLMGSPEDEPERVGKGEESE